VQIIPAPAHEPRPTHHRIDDSAATVLLIEDEHITVTREPPRAVFHLRRSITGHELVHPYLAGAAGVFSTWLGRMAFHAGGVIVDGHVWGVLGRKEAGKTTTLAHLHLEGFSIVTDDLLVLDGATVLAGPRCLDLRPSTWRNLAESGHPVDGVAVRDGERRRLALPDAPATLPFAGWVLLEEGPEVDVRPVPPSQRFAILTREHLVAGKNQIGLLDQIAAPMWVLERPRSWAAMPRALDALLTAVRSSAPHASSRRSS
jgi:hypothetical protein